MMHGVKIVVVTGGREIFDDEGVAKALNPFHQKFGGKMILYHGGAKGIDDSCSRWAQKMGVGTVMFPADWITHRKAAGPIRNKKMVQHAVEAARQNEGSAYSAVFPGGNGTAHCHETMQLNMEPENIYLVGDDMRKVIELVDGKTAKFEFYRQGVLYYSVDDFTFPVPISDLGTATCNNEEKGIFFMRYIRKHLETLEEMKNAAKS